MATVDMHREFGKVWHVVFKICEQTYKHKLGWKCAVTYRMVFYIAFKSRMFCLFAWVCLAQNYC